MILARMRSPACICARCPAVCAADDIPGELEMRVDVLFLSAFLMPILLTRRGGIAGLLPAVAYGFMSFSVQSEGWENRALSLERDFIDETVMEFP